MSIRTTLVNGTWTNIGTGPALVQVISPDATGATVEILCQTTQPTGDDGIVLNAELGSAKFNLAQTIWARGIAGNCVVAVQPDVAA